MFTRQITPTGHGKAHRRLRNTEPATQIGLTEPQRVDRPIAQKASGADGFGLFAGSPNFVRNHPEDFGDSFGDPRDIDPLGLQRIFFSKPSVAWEKTCSTKSPLPRMRSSPFSTKPLFRIDFTPTHPAALRTNPPPTRSSLLPVSIPLRTYSLYLRRAARMLPPNHLST